MTDTTITISENAYKALEKLKGKSESINNVILRLTKRFDLIEYIESTDFLIALIRKDKID
jgi:predicted CopG family antitoxin